MAITKREFATKLLFWLLPRPISKALPRALRIYYFGPGGAPPPDFYNYYGVPGDFWADPYNPFGPPVYHYPQVGKGDVFFDQNYWVSAYVNTSWELGHWHCVFPYGDPNNNLLPVGTWAVNYRPNWIHISWSGKPADQIHFKLSDTDDNMIASQNNVEKDFYMAITYNVPSYDIELLHFESRIDPEEPININLIEFLS